MVDSGVSGYYFNDAIIRDLKSRLQDYAHLATPRKILNVGGALPDVTAEGMLQGLVADACCSQISVRTISMVPGIGRNLFLVRTAAKKSVVTVFNSEKPRLEGLTSPCCYGAKGLTSTRSRWT